MKFNRRPDGAFMDQGSALFHWLPLMLGWARNPVKETIEALAKHFVDKAAHEHQRCAAVLPELGDPERTSHAEWSALKAARAAKFLRQREILLQALKDIEAVDK